MKTSRILLTVLAAGMLCLALVNLASAQYLNPDETPEQLLARADSEIFVKNPVLTQDFSQHQGYVNEIVQTDTLNLVQEYFIYGGYGTDMLYAMDTAGSSYRNPNIRLSFNTVWKPMFHVSLNFQKGDEEPAGGGRCWIRYSDIVIAGKGNEKGVLLYPGEKAYYFETTRGEVSYTEIADLSGVSLLRDDEFDRTPVLLSEAEDPVLDEYGVIKDGSFSQFFGMDVFRRDIINPSGADPSRYNRLDVIRLDGVSFFYINGKFMFQYEDGIRNALSFDAGAEILEGGMFIECNFDDFVMRAL